MKNVQDLSLHLWDTMSSCLHGAHVGTGFWLLSDVSAAELHGNSFVKAHIWMSESAIHKHLVCIL